MADHANQEVSRWLGGRARAGRVNAFGIDAIGE
jgi:hypothetical protein